MTTFKQDQKFMKDMIPQSFLEDAIDWIKNNMNPEDVFPPSDLEIWAKDSGFIKEPPQVSS